MRRVQCIITGCNLVLPHGGWQAGDLHMLDTCYIFNAVGEMRAEHEVKFYKRELYLIDGADWFDRRNVYVFPITHARLNQVAIDYLAAREGN